MYILRRCGAPGTGVCQGREARLNIAELLAQLRQLRKYPHRPEPLFVGHGGESGNDFPVSNIAANAAASGGHDLMTDGDMISDARLAAEHDVMSGSAAARDPDLRHQNVVFADLHVMRNLDKVIDFCPPPYPRCAEGGAIHCDISPQFDIVFNHHRTDLRNLVMSALMLEKSEAVATDDRAGMNDNAVANRHAFSDRHIRIDQAISADRCPASDEHTRINLCAASDPNAVVNRGKRPDGNMIAEGDIFSDLAEIAYAFNSRGLDEKVGHDLRHRQRGMRHDNLGAVEFMDVAMCQQQSGAAGRCCL